MTLSTIELETGINPSVCVIWMHGLGADGNDFVPIVEELDLTGCPPIRFIFPNAPVMPVTINGGYPMPAWYDILGNDIAKREDAKGLYASQAMIEELIKQANDRGISNDKIILAGFSQGCAMALHVGLRYPQKLAGLLCLSGYLALADKFPQERHPANFETPIFMAHGNQDSVVPLTRAELSRDTLNAHQYQIEWHTYPMAHSVCDLEVKHIGAWLRKILSS